MHIMEGFLPAKHALAWGGVSAPFVALGVRSLGRRMRENPGLKMLAGVSAAFAFVLSALKLPSLTGSSSHPTGTGLGAVLFGPFAMAPVALVVLLFQALLLAHGGLTTLGANVFSMGVVGPAVAWTVFRLARAAPIPLGTSVFLAAMTADLATYATTTVQLALAFPDPAGGIVASLVKFASVFAVTQIPLSVSEGLLSALILNALLRHSPEDLIALRVLFTGKGER